MSTLKNFFTKKKFIFFSIIIFLFWASTSSSVLLWTLRHTINYIPGVFSIQEISGSLFHGIIIKNLKFSNHLLDAKLKSIELRWHPLALLLGRLHIRKIHIKEVDIHKKWLSEKNSAEKISFLLPIIIDSINIQNIKYQDPKVQLPDFSFALSARHYPRESWDIKNVVLVSPNIGTFKTNLLLSETPPYSIRSTGKIYFDNKELDNLKYPIEISTKIEGTLEHLHVTAAIYPTNHIDSITLKKNNKKNPLIQLKTEAYISSKKNSASTEIVFSDFSSHIFKSMQFFPESTISGLIRTQYKEGLPVTGDINLNNNFLRNLKKSSNIPWLTFSSEFSLGKSQLYLPTFAMTFIDKSIIKGTSNINFAEIRKVGNKQFPGITLNAALENINIASWNNQLPESQLNGAITLNEKFFSAKIMDAKTSLSLDSQLTFTQEKNSFLHTFLSLKMQNSHFFLEGDLQDNTPYFTSLKGNFANINISTFLHKYKVFLPEKILDTSEGKGNSRFPKIKDFLQAEVSGSWATKGSLWPLEKLAINLDLTQGVWNKNSFYATMKTILSTSSSKNLEIKDLLLIIKGKSKSKPNLLEVKGDWGEPQDILFTKIHMPHLDWIQPQISGEFYGTAKILGGQFFSDRWFKNTHIQCSAQNFMWQDAFSVKKMFGELKLLDNISLTPHALKTQFFEKNIFNAISELKLEINDLEIPRKDHFQKMDLSILEEQKTKILKAEVIGNVFSGSALIKGNFSQNHQAEQWRGLVQSFSVNRPLAFNLANPVEIDISFAETLSLKVGSGLLSFGDAGGNISFSKLAYTPQSWVFSGATEHLKVFPWFQAYHLFSEKTLHTLTSAGLDDRFDKSYLNAQWNISSNVGWKQSSGTLSLKFFLDENNLAADSNWTVQKGILSGPMQFSLPLSLLFHDSVVPNWKKSGLVSYQGKISGTLSDPRLYGYLHGKDLYLKQMSSGWSFSNGEIEAHLKPDQLDIDKISFYSESGKINLKGKWNLDDYKGRFDLITDRFPVLLGLGKRILVSGHTQLNSIGSHISWTGSVQVDEGLLDLTSDQVTIAEDIRLIDNIASVTKENGDSQKETLQLEPNITLYLGDNLRVRGEGIAARLAGKLNLQGIFPGKPFVTGTIKIIQGSYVAYGTKLDITRGRVLFNGSLDNPALDIITMRKNQSVEAGVSISGTLLFPNVQLISNPDLPDSAKLSWLLFGSGPNESDTGTQDMALQSLTTALLSGISTQPDKGLTGSLGLDVFSIRSASSSGPFDPNFGANFPGKISSGLGETSAISQNVVAIGKKLGKDLFITYEQGLYGVWHLLKVQYDINKRLSIRAQTGSDRAIDLLYSISFD